MKVTVSTKSLGEVIPELIPALREHGDDLPETFEIEGCLTVDEQLNREMRAKYPEYWDQFTGMEWLVWCRIVQPDGATRAELRVFVRGMSLGIDAYERFIHSNSTDVHVKNIRNTLRRLGNKHWIETKRGWGYLVHEGVEPESNRDFRFNRREFDSEANSPRERHAKKIDAEGKVVIPKWRIDHDRLNAVEFGYVKEMLMDDKRVEEIATTLSITILTAQRAVSAPDFDRYIESFSIGTGGSPKHGRTNHGRRCGLCKETGHYMQTCPTREMPEGEAGEGFNFEKHIPTPRFCGNCGESGHNARTCTKAEGGRPFVPTESIEHESFFEEQMSEFPPSA